MRIVFAKLKLSQAQANVQTAVHFLCICSANPCNFEVQILQMNFVFARCGFSECGLSFAAFPHIHLSGFPFTWQDFFQEKGRFHLFNSFSTIYFLYYSEFKFVSRSELDMAFKTHYGWFRGAWGGSHFDLWQIVLAGLAPAVQKAEVSAKKYTVGREGGWQHLP